jgi:hypothetical protein
MTTLERFWVTVIFVVAGILLVTGVAQAGPRGHGPVYIPPILHQDSQQPDKLLSRAFRDAVALRVPVTADWRLTDPDPTVCRTGCVVVRIAGRRAPSPQYVLALRSFPRGAQVASTQITGPTDTTPALLADALLLKTSFLLRLDLTRARRATPTVVATRAPAPSPLQAPPRGRGRPRLELALSGTALVGMTDHMLAGGMEVSAALRLVGAFHLKAGVGFLGAGQVEDGLSTFSVLPVSALVGFQWSWRWFQLGVFAGATMFVFWVDFNQGLMNIPSNTGFTGISGGPTAEVRLAVRLHRYVSIGLTNRVTYAPVDLSSYVWDNYQTARFTVPRGLIQSSLDVTFTF